MLIGAITLLVVLLIALTAVILIDMRGAGWPNWLATLREWQSTLGTVVGFLGAAAVLVLGTALQRQADEQRAFDTASAIGQALAYEAERMSTGLELGRQIGLSANLDKPDDVARQCTNMAQALQQQLQAHTPVFDASIQRLVDFGAENLSNFVRFYAFYADLRQSVGNINAETCAGVGTEQLQFMISQMKIGLGYYQAFAPSYPIVQFGPDGPVASVE